jgi:HlyD family secretion protein
MNEQARLPDAEILDRLGLPAPRRRRRGLIALAAVAVVAAIAGTAFYFFNATPETTYVTADVVRGPLVVRVSATGTLQPEDQVDVGAEISGRLDRVAVDFNDRVTKGQVLAVINTDQIRAQLAQAKAELGAAQASVVTNEATVKETKDRRDRAEGLFTRGIVSQQDFQTSEADYARAVASVAKARADVANATAKVQLSETSLDKAAVRSPIDGIVLDRKVQQGQTVASQFQTPVLFTLASDLARMKLEVDIDEADIGQVREGQTATFSVDAFPQRRFDAKLTSLRNAPKTTNGVVTYQGVLEVDNSEGLLRPGLTATVDILVAEADDTLLVPNGALRFTPPGGDAVAPPLVPSNNGELVGRVWVMEDAKPVARDLRIGRSDGRNTQVLSGDLMPGDDVIVDTATGRAP